jgi:acyl-coenzyme A synthetase/AMP-(fatty) acid ligase/thioesterase domain-containing protein
VITAAQRDVGLVEHFARVADDRGGEVAVSEDGSTLTYGDLDERSNGVAAEVVDRVGAGRDLVAVLSGSGIETAIALLGVLKSERPFACFDPLMPAARLRQIRDLGGIELVVASPQQLDLAFEVMGGHGACLPVGSQRSGVRPAVSLGPRDTANVTFTSGSTGAPKGVVVPHRYLSWFAWSHSQFLGFGSRDRVGFVLPFSFSYGLLVGIRTLLLGATLLPRDPRVHGVADLLAWIRGERIEVLEATPSLLRALTSELRPGEILDSLKIVCSGGEALFGADVMAISDHLSENCKFLNVIGTSEAGEFARYVIQPSDRTRPGIVPVGFASEEKRVELVGPSGEPVAAGETGEIVVESCYLSRGYLPGSEAPTGRFSDLGGGVTRYRTGDLGRFETDGALVYLGRGDAMVKIRGYLVEPAEVEGAMLSTGMVREVAVQGVGGDSERPHLAAWVVPRDGVRSSPAALRQALRVSVPEYMVPRHIVVLDQLPHNANGKVDSTHLPALPDRDQPFVAPRTSWEQAVAGVWREALGVDRVGAFDDFFALGGDSLAVEEVVAALTGDYGIAVGSEALVEAPILGDFASRARRRPPKRSTICVPLRSSGNRPPLFICAGGGGLAVSFVPLTLHLDHDQPVYGLQTHGLEGRGIPDRSIRTLARRYVKAIQTVQPRGPYLISGHSAGGLFAYEVAQQLRKSDGAAVALLVLFDSVPPRGSTVSEQLRHDVFGTPPFPATGEGLSQHARSALRALKRRTHLPAWVEATKEGLRPGPHLRHFGVFFDYSVHLVNHYHPQPWPGRTVLYTATEGDIRSHANDWKPYLPTTAAVYPTNGDHWTMFRYPNAESLAGHLQEQIDQALNNHHPHHLNIPPRAGGGERPGVST